MKNLIFILSLFISTTLFAQTTTKDVLQLKNKSTIEGKIIEENALIIKIKVDDYVLEFERSEITKIEKNVEVKEKVDREVPEIEYKTSGYVNTSEVGVIIGSGAAAGFIIHSTHDYQLNEKLAIGGGAGLELLSNGGFIPLFLNTNITPIKGKLQPLGYFNVGYALGYLKSISGMTWGGLLINPGLGLRIHINSDIALNVSLGYRFQQVANAIYDFEKENFVKSGTTGTNYIQFKVGTFF